MRRRHKFKSHSHRLGLLKKYFLESETGSDSPDINSNSPIYSFSTDIPDNYQESYICALPINPDFLFTYWELAPDYVAQKVKEADTDLNLILRIRKVAPLENDPQADLSEVDTTSTFCKPEEDVKYLINNRIGDMVIEVPDAEDYVMEIVHTTERGDDILLASHEIIDTFSHDSEVILYCNNDIVDANEYFDDKEECSQKKKTKESSMELDYKLCTKDYNQYLGSASYEN